MIAAPPVARTPRVVVELRAAGGAPGRVAPDLVELTVAARREIVPVRAADVSAVPRACAAARAEAAARGPGVSILVELAVLLAAGTGAARQRLAELERAERWIPPGLRYLGTPAGLAGLIIDLHRAAGADGVLLRPISPAAVGGPLTTGTVPELERLGVRIAPGAVRRLCPPAPPLTVPAPWKEQPCPTPP
ncbi:hypothetical protein [Nocardia harenae]|uniref:hypothetical protein n=1 Tax=Nocardia harenae TaxID=358707 RepID=UPI00082B85CA|nr:hypothetical protein [Nocardia harenae]